MSRSSHRTLEDARAQIPDDLVEVCLTLRGGSAPADHRYVLHSCLKRRCCSDLTDRGWQLRPITQGTIRGEICDLDRAEPEVWVRLPKQDITHLLDLCEAPIELGSHVLIVDDTMVREVRPSNTVQSELVLICNQDRAPQGYWPAELGVKIGTRLGAWFGRSDFGVAVGDRRSWQCNGYDYYGHPVRVTALSDDESLFLQRHGLGARQSMGCGTLWPCDDGLTMPEGLA